MAYFSLGSKGDDLSPKKKSAFFGYRDEPFASYGDEGDYVDPDLASAIQLQITDRREGLTTLPQ